MIRQLSIELRKQGLNFIDLASHFRLYNHFIKSGAADDRIESFITNVGTGDVFPEKVIALVNQLYDVSQEQSIPVQEVPKYIERKLEEKKKIEEELREADSLLQNKNVRLQAIDEHIKLNEELNKHGLFTHGIPGLVNLLKNAKRYGFDGKEIADKLYNIQELEWKEKQLKDKCKTFSKRVSKFKDVVPLTEDSAAWGIGIDELLAIETGINQVAKFYNLPFVSVYMHLIEDIKNIIK